MSFCSWSIHLVRGHPIGLLPFSLFSLLIDSLDQEANDVSSCSSLVSSTETSNWRIFYWTTRVTLYSQTSDSARTSYLTRSSNVCFQEQRAYSFCGTIEYMAPEVVRGGNTGHDITRSGGRMVQGVNLSIDWTADDEGDRGFNPGWVYLGCTFISAVPLSLYVNVDSCTVQTCLFTCRPRKNQSCKHKHIIGGHAVAGVKFVQSGLPVTENHEADIQVRLKLFHLLPTNNLVRQGDTCLKHDLNSIQGCYQHPAQISHKHLFGGFAMDPFHFGTGRPELLISRGTSLLDRDRNKISSRLKRFTGTGLTYGNLARGLVTRTGGSPEDLR
uniref:Uncharacterized protein n=1 Tax=Timema genevievae TaxID=629358 RepID=A0A7R9JX84_TIMGE|nr:unnamed protein product [Timema genevievae]